MKSVGLAPDLKPAQPGKISLNFLGAPGPIGVENEKEAEPSQEPQQPSAQASGVTADDQVRDILVQHPGITGATLVNKIKASGLVVSESPGVAAIKSSATEEADASGGFPQATRAGVKKESAKRNLTIRAHFKEGSAQGNAVATKYDVILIQEGLGNFRDAYYYTKEAIVSGVALFEGKKIYADHPSEIDEQVRPERSVKDILGHFENVRVEEGSGGQSMLCASVQILPDRPYDWARALMAHSVEYAKKYPDKDFVGLSINASGDANEMQFDEFLKSVSIPDSAAKKLADAQAEGIQSVRVVSEITDAVSVDLVTEAGAGGRVRSMLEENKKRETKMKQEENVKEDSVSMDAGKNGPALKEGEEKQTEALPPAADGADKKDDGDADDKAPPKKEDEAADDKPAAGDDKSADHGDEDQDKELIKKMLDQYIGPASHPEEYMQAAHEALGHAKAAGMDDKEAMKAAGYSMKMAHVMKNGKEASVAQGGADSQSMQQAEGAKKEDESKKECAEGKSKESAKPTDEVTKLRGENAALKEKIAVNDTEKHLDKILKESGLKMEVTKKFRETIGKVTTPKVIDEKFALFLEGYKQADGGKADGSIFGFHTGDEKGATSFTSESSFADCVKE